MWKLSSKLYTYVGQLVPDVIYIYIIIPFPRKVQRIIFSCYSTCIAFSVSLNPMEGGRERVRSTSETKRRGDLLLCASNSVSTPLNPSGTSVRSRPSLLWGGHLGRVGPIH